MDEKILNTTGRTNNTALVVDDELSNRVILKSLLKRFGYLVLEAKSGQEGVDLFRTYKPDVVFMDVLMPDMDGYEATTKIKALAGERFVPVIFLTALTDEPALVRCIEVGGDDFLTKPFSHTILRSKLRALERIRTLHWEVERLYGRMRLEEEIAQKVFSIAVMGRNVAMQQIPHLLQSAAIFSGDLLLTAWAPSGDLHLLLGDFTGHGLSAALGALPAAAVFRAMTAKGFPPERILAAINEELHTLLPSGMFLAATFLLVSKNLDYAQVFNIGMPDGLVLDQTGVICQRLPAELVPLGILPWQNMVEARQYIHIAPHWRILLVSDGVTEARAPNGTLFGSEGLETAIQASIDNKSVLDTVNTALDSFCGAIPQTDDVSLVEIPCVPSLFEPSTPSQLYNSVFKPQPQPIEPCDTAQSKAAEIHWQVGISLYGVRLARVDPVPILISQIQELEDVGFDNRILFSLLTKLYNVALGRVLTGMEVPLAEQPTDPVDVKDILRKHEERLSNFPLRFEINIRVQCEQLPGARRCLRVLVASKNKQNVDKDEGIIWL